MKTNIIKAGTVVAIVSVLITCAVLYANVCAKVSANTTYRQYSENMLENKLETIRWRLEKIEEKLDKLLGAIDK